MPLANVHKLYDAQDAIGETYSVFASDHAVAHDHFMSLYFKNFAYLLDKGWAISSVLAVKPEYRAVWVEDKNGKCVGGVMWEWLSSIKQGFIILIFTDEELRGRRIYSIVQKGLEDETIRIGGTSIASTAHIDNASRLKAGERDGMLPQFHRLYKDLTPIIIQRKASKQVK